MYYIGKVKSWIKKSAKSTMLSYCPEVEMITDNVAIIHVNQKMKPAILEALGTLEGSTVYVNTPWGNAVPKAEAMKNFMELRSVADQIELVDSGLRFTEDKEDFHVLYEAKTGKKVLIKECYAEMIKDFDLCELYACKDCDGGLIHVCCEGEVVACIARVIPLANSEILNAFDFKVSEEVRV